MATVRFALRFSAGRQRTLCLFSGLLLLSLPAKPQSISSIASGLNYPVRVAVDSARNAYIADTFNNRILRIAGDNGAITTLAGNGTPGFSGDGGPATSAALSGPWGVATDLPGDVYIADSGNSRIRKVTIATGVITTVAGNGAFGFSGDGGPPASATLNYPLDVAVDVRGNIYIADTFNERIRKISSGAGAMGADVITTIAGNGIAGYSGDGATATSASLNHPIGVAVDGIDQIFGATAVYIADSYNHRVRKVDLGGQITTVAGNGVAGFSGDGGAAASASLDYPFGVAANSGNLYIADSFNSRIRMVSPATGAISTLAGIGGQSFSGDGGPAASAGLDTPYGVAVDYSGAVYMTDTGNGRIRKVLPPTTTGTITTVALADATGLAVDSSGNLYYSSFSGSRVYKVVLATGVTTRVAGNMDPICFTPPLVACGNFNGDGIPATTANLGYPRGVAVDSRGNLYIADYLNLRVRRVDADTGLISTVAGNGAITIIYPPPGIIGLGHPEAVYSGDGGLAVNAGVPFPTDVAFDKSGNLYITLPFAGSSPPSNIRKVDGATGVITTVAGNGSMGFSGDGGPATDASLNQAWRIALDTSGNLYIADAGNNRIRKVSGATGVITTFAGNGVAAFSGDGGVATDASLNDPTGVAVDSSGNVYIADTGNNRVRKVAAGTNVITTVAGNGIAAFIGDGGPATSASLNSPSWLAIDAGGNLYIFDATPGGAGNFRIRKVTGVAQ